jgi:hypothetical protein
VTTFVGGGSDAVASDKGSYTFWRSAGARARWAGVAAVASIPSIGGGGTLR